ncbi:hypothetical protein [Kitasatospora sp. NPDC088346]|uniref:WXG100-like domain-containing protein n=1 Tax=Kitasatospora sp. NPDC088346 TaxID=3364073 RepID=UPI00382735C4
MIELPADLAEVLKTVQSSPNGSGIAFPDADEGRLAELAAAWEAWNTAADPRVRSIVASAQQALAHMSGEAADNFQQYLEKYAGRDNAHAVTTLETGLAMARCLRGASDSVTRAKTAMVQQLRSTKEYLDAGLPGALPEVAGQSEGVRKAAESCKEFAGQVGADVDSMLRQSAGQVERMTGAGQACLLGGVGTAYSATAAAGVDGPADGAAGGASAAAARPVLAGLGGPATLRSEFASAEVPGAAACRPGAGAPPGLNLAGFTGADAGTGAQSGPSSGGVGDPAAAAGSSSGSLGAAGAGGAGGRLAAGGGLSGRARAGSTPSVAGASLGMRSGTAAGAAGAAGRAGTVGQAAPGMTRQTPASGTAGTGARAGAGAAAAGASAGRGPGMGGMHGMGHGGGRKGPHGRPRAGLVVEQVAEDEALADSGVHGRATEAQPGDRQTQRARQRWLDDARTGTVEQRRAGAPPAAAAREERPPAPAGDFLTQLTGVVLGPKAGNGGQPGAGTATGMSGAGAGAGAGAGVGQPEGRPSAEAPYPEQIGAAAARRQGAPGQGAPGIGAGAPNGADTGGKPAQRWEEGGYQVPSPQLRAALAKLAAAGELDRARSRQGGPEAVRAGGEPPAVTGRGENV